MNSFNVTVRKISDAFDETSVTQSIQKIMGTDTDIFRFVPIIFEISNATRDFMLRLPTLMPNCIVKPIENSRETEFVSLPQIGTSGDAYEIWKNFLKTAILTRYRLDSMFSGFNTDILMPGIIKSNFLLLTTIYDTRSFILKYEKKWNSKPDAYTREWESLMFAKRLFDCLRETNPDIVGDIIFHLDPDITSEVPPIRNWIRVSRETVDGDKPTYNLHVFTVFAFHMLPERPLNTGGNIVARHFAEAGDIEVADNDGTMFLFMSTDSRIDVFSGNPNRHGLRIYGEWEYHSLQRAVQAYIKNPGINGQRKPRKYNVTFIFQNAQDLEEFCFIFANS